MAAIALRSLNCGWPARAMKRSPDAAAASYRPSRQRGKRMTVIWLLVILTLTGLVAAAAWTVGSNLNGLF